MYNRIKEMHTKFGIEGPTYTVSQLTEEEYRFRVTCMFEELFEYCEAVFEGPLVGDLKSIVNKYIWHFKRKQNIDGDNLADQFDALIDICVFTLGTAERQGFPFVAGFNIVMDANMKKQIGPTKRGYQLDLFKPEGWKTPDLKYLIENPQGDNND